MKTFSTDCGIQGIGEYHHNYTSSQWNWFNFRLNTIHWEAQDMLVDKRTVKARNFILD